MNSAVKSDREIYFEKSKENIDNYLKQGKCSSAFGLLVSVLNRLDNEERDELIKYYEKNTFDFLKQYSYSQSHFFTRG